MLERPYLVDQLQNYAWIGDAVLSLYARTKIIGKTGRSDGDLLARLTSNKSLACLGEPTKIEAAIGRVYLEEGLLEAFLWIEARLMRLFERQEENRLRKNVKR